MIVGIAVEIDFISSAMWYNSHSNLATKAIRREMHL